MDINMKLYQPFVAAMNKNRAKYGEQMEKINGFHNSNLNFTDFIDNFVDTKVVADVTIDPNANSATHDINTLVGDMMKPHQKLLSYNKIFYEITKKYGLIEAEKWLENEWSGAFHLHDSSSASQKPYCFAYDLEDLMVKGLFFIDKFKTPPAQHLTTFMDHVCEFVSWNANRTSGAVGLPTLLYHTYYFWYKDVKEGYYLKDPETYRRQCFQKFIYDINQPHMRIVECAFTNVSIMDREYLTELFGGRVFPNGECAIDHIEGMIEHQKVFMEVVSEIRSKNMMTFPVLSYALLYKDGKFVDEEFAHWCSDHNSKWYDSNFMNANDVSIFSNCCFDANQPVLVRTTELGSKMMSIKDFYELPAKGNKNNPKVFHNGSWVKARCIRLPGRKEYLIKTVNGKNFVATDNHINVTLDGEKRTDKLTINDYIAFNTRPLDSVREAEHNLTYEEGFLIGVYAGDGSQSRGEHQNSRGSTQITLSLNESNCKDLETIRRALKQISGENINVGITMEGKLMTVRFSSAAVYDFIFSYVHGTHADIKEFDMSALTENQRFRRGIVDGWYASDGGNSNRIYTTSKKLIDTGDAIFTSLGMNTTIDVVDRTGETEIKGKKYNRNFPLWCIRWYESTNRRVLKDVYIVKNNTMYFKIKSIEEVKPTDEYCYCFEMKNEKEPYFTLPSGIITHNCRLLSDSSKLTGFINSIGGTALSIGSVKVNTINIRRVSLEANHDVEKFMEILAMRTLRCCEVLAVQRDIIHRNVEKGLLPNYTYGLIDFNKQYSTIGIIGIYEALCDFGLIATDKFGYKTYTDDAVAFVKRLFDTINLVKDNFKCDFTFNIECIPGESAARKLYEKDSIIYGDAAKINGVLYSNQWIPLTAQCSMDEKIRLGSILDKLASGGQIAHINLESQISPEMHWNLLNKIAASGLMYFAFNPKISVCKNNHGFFGDICPECGEPVADYYSRIVGYLVPTKSYSAPRKAEFNERKWYKVE